MSKKVLIKGRYGLKHHLVPDENEVDLYTLEEDKKGGDTRLIGDNFDDLEAVDPSGGPYISKGFKLLNKVVKSIFYEADGDKQIYIRLE